MMNVQDLTNIQGYSSVAKMDQPITKYLFADNGKVYEYQFKPNSEPSLSTGFATKDYNGKDPNLKPNEKFTVSKDKILNKNGKCCFQNINDNILKISNINSQFRYVKIYEKCYNCEWKNNSNHI